MSANDLLTVTEAAEALTQMGRKIGGAGIRYLIREGRLTAQLSPGLPGRATRYLVRRGDLNSITRGRPGRPKKVAV